MSKKPTTPSLSSLDSILRAKVPGTGISIAALLLTFFATLGMIPPFMFILKSFVAEATIAGSITLLLAAIVSYYLLAAESTSEWLKKHPISFIVLIVALLILAYMYIPEFKAIFGSSSSAITQTVSLLVRP